MNLEKLGDGELEGAYERIEQAMDKANVLSEVTVTIEFRDMVTLLRALVILTDFDDDENENAEYIDPFNPSKEDFHEIMNVLRAKLRLTHGPEDEVFMRAGDLVVLMAGAMRALKERKSK
jgi:hypothetical protein